MSDPQPGPGEVLVRVQACGICLSDVHLIDGTLPSPLERVTPGHEPAGVIERLGEGVSERWSVGTRVLMAAGKPCENSSRRRFALTRFRLYAGLTDRAGLRQGESVGLWGIGGLGIHAVMVARMVGAAPIIAPDPSEPARERALDRGADHALDPTEDGVEQKVRELTDGLGLDVAVDLYGSNRVLVQADACLGRFGRLLIIGLSAEPISLGPNAVFGVSSHSLLGHLGYDKAHLDQLISFVAGGRLDVSGSISDVMPLEDVVRGVERLATKEGNPIRLLVAP